jgi:hypothetical protein
VQAIDKIIFGDNQFFGINHMSQEKAQSLAEKFFDIHKIFQVYDMAFESGIKGIMLNSNDRASIPYPHKYANLVAEKGIFPAISEVIFKDTSALDVLGIVSKGGMAVLGKDTVKMMQMLVDVEMKIFKGLHIKAIFLQNIITDLLLGYGIKEIFYEYCEYIRKKYNALPGLITQNLPYLLNKLQEWDIKEVVICSSFNKIGYLMSPDINNFIKTYLVRLLCLIIRNKLSCPKSSPISNTTLSPAFSRPTRIRSRPRTAPLISCGRLRAAFLPLCLSRCLCQARTGSYCMWPNFRSAGPRSSSLSS